MCILTKDKNLDFKNLTIVVPAYNEGIGIASILQDLKRTLPAVTIIVVNDGSEDDTERRIKNVEGVILINHKHNRGMGAALKTGMQGVKTAAVSWYDADGQHRPEDLTRTAKQVLDGKKDVAIGVRNEKDFNKTPGRLLGKFILKKVVQFITKTDVPDFNSGLRSFRTEVIKKYLHLLPNRFSASTVSTVIMIKRNYRIGYVPIITNSRKGKSSLKFFRDGALNLYLILRMLILFEAFALFATLSLLQVTFGLLYSGYLILTKKPAFSFLALLIIISGIATFFIGIIVNRNSKFCNEKIKSA